MVFAARWLFQLAARTSFKKRKESSMHRLLILTVMFCCFASSIANAAYVDEVLADNPVAYWRMDEMNDREAPVDATGTVTTVADGWNDQGGMAFGEPGIPGTDGTSVLFQSEQFSFACNAVCGAGSVMLDEDFQDGLLDLGTIGDGTPITMEAWFTLLEGWETSSYPRLFHYNNADGGQYTFGIVGNDVPATFPEARTVFAGRGDGGGGSVILAAESDTLPSEDDVNEGEYYHLVAHSQGSDIRLWLNGQELTELFDSDPIGWQARQATIGARVQNSFELVQSFPGTIDELAIYNTLLTEDRIQAHYQAGIGNAPVLDINELQDAIKAGSNDARFDINGDGAVNLLDQDAFVENDLNTWTGDANLDGEFNSGDLVAAFTQGEYEDNDPARPETIMNSRWEDGDWNADREFRQQRFRGCVRGRRLRNRATARRSCRRRSGTSQRYPGCPGSVAGGSGPTQNAPLTDDAVAADHPATRQNRIRC